MTRWDFLMAQRRYFWGMGWLMFGLAVLVAAARFVIGRASLNVPAETLFALFGMWGFTMAQVLQQMGAQQAAIDMRRAARGEKPE